MTVMMVMMVMMKMAVMIVMMLMMVMIVMMFSEKRDFNKHEEDMSIRSNDEVYLGTHY